MAFGNLFSQLSSVRHRREHNKHPVDELGRFYLLICCFFCSTTVSITYAFDLFTTTFQNQFGLSTGDLTTISTVGLVFCYFTIPYSLIYENLGPFLLFWVCCLCALIGGLCLALTISGKIPGNTATLSIFYAFLNVPSGLVDTAYVSVLVEVFPRNRGPVMALAKVMTSLGSSALACVYSSFFGGNMAGFIYFLMAFVMAVDVWAAFTVMLPPYYLNWWRRRGKTEEELFELEIVGPYYERKSVPMPRLAIGYVITVLQIIFYTVEAPVVAYSKNGVPHGAHIAIGVISVVLIFSIFLMLLPLEVLGGVSEPAPQGAEKRAIEAEFRAVYARLRNHTGPTEGEQPSWLQESQVEKLVHEVPTVPDSNSGSNEEPANDDTIDADGLPVLSPTDVEEVHESRQDPRYRGNFLDYLCHVDVWLIMLLFVTYSCTGTIVMYNSSSLSVALSGRERSDDLSTLYTAFLGVSSAVGRIGFGLFEAFVQHQKPGHRLFIITTALPFSPLLSFLGSLFLLVLPGSAVLFPFILVNLEEGVFAGVNALIFSCLFEGNHNSLYNMSFLVQCITIICYNRLMFGLYVDSQESKYRAEGRIPADVTGCTIPECVHMPLIVSCVLGFIGIFVAVAIHIRYSRFVRSVHNARAQCAEMGLPYVPSDGSNALSRWIRRKCGGCCGSSSSTEEESNSKHRSREEDEELRLQQL